MQILPNLTKNDLSKFYITKYVLHINKDGGGGGLASFLSKFNYTKLF